MSRLDCNMQEEQTALIDRITEFVRKHGLLLVLILFAAEMLQPLYQLFWFDEVLTNSLVFWSESFRHLYLSYDIPNNHIVYSAVLRCIRVISETFHFNVTIWMLRLPSVLFAAGALILIYRMIRRKSDSLAASGLILLIAFMPPFCQFAGALRGYMLSFLLVLSAAWSARKIAENGSGKYWFLYGVFCLLAAGTIPSNLAALLLIGLTLLPSCIEKKRMGMLLFLFLIPIAALVLFYLPVMEKFLKCAGLSEGWGSRSKAILNLYLAFVFPLLPVIVFVFLRRVKHLRFSLRTLCILLEFSGPLFAWLIFPKIFFPRVFFPCFAVWILTIGDLWRDDFCGSKEPLQKGLLFACFVWAALVYHLALPLSNAVFGPDGSGDDLLAPYHKRITFNPGEVARTIGKAQREMSGLRVYLTFDSDYQSVLFAGENSDVPFDTETICLYDKPNAVPLQSISGNPLWIVCRDENDLKNAVVRFKLAGTVRLIKNTGHQKIYELIR